MCLLSVQSCPVGSLAWTRDAVRFPGSNPATWTELDPAQKKIFKNFLKKFCDFPVYFSINFVKYWFVFLYRKDTNPVLKYQVFIKTLNFFFKKTRFYFMHTAKYLKKNISYFHTTKIKKYVLTCILALITSLLKSRELAQYFKNSNFFFF
jgi:hypothetical protein